MRESRVGLPPVIGDVDRPSGLARSDAVGAMVVGVSWFGWTLRSTAEQMALERANAAVVAILTPSCVARFMREPDAAVKVAEVPEARLVEAAAVHRRRRMGHSTGEQDPQLHGCERMCRGAGQGQELASAIRAPSTWLPDLRGTHPVRPTSGGAAASSLDLHRPAAHLVSGGGRCLSTLWFSSVRAWPDNRSTDPRRFPAAIVIEAVSSSSKAASR
jgi:hypothetical protein